MKKNTVLRSYAKNSGVYLWELADSMKISVETLQRRLRYELSDHDRNEMMKMIDEISKTKGD